jgi:hypothetical protein
MHEASANKKEKCPEKKKKKKILREGEDKLIPFK